MTDQTPADQAARRVAIFYDAWTSHHGTIDRVIAQVKPGSADMLTSNDLGLLLAERQRLLPLAAAGKRAGEAAAHAHYQNAGCGDCGCCTLANCQAGRCPTNSIGDSICPCTED